MIIRRNITKIKLTALFILVLFSVLLCGCKTQKPRKLTKQEKASIKQEQKREEEEERIKKIARDEAIEDIMIYHFLFR